MAGKQQTFGVFPNTQPWLILSQSGIYSGLRNVLIYFLRSDSTRRSGRATKGQHSKKDLEVEDAVPQKKGSKGRKAKNEPSPPPDEEDGEAIIRCICGCTVENEDDKRAMICCESCNAWQHNECMEVSEDDDELPDEYYCERCRPRDHKALLEKIERGEKPWEERARQRAIEEEEKKTRKGRGKKGKRGRPSNARNEEIEINGAEVAEGSTMQLEDAPQEDAKKTVEAAPEAAPEPPQVDNNKRKLSEDPKTTIESQDQVVSSLTLPWPIQSDHNLGASEQIAQDLKPNRREQSSHANTFSSQIRCTIGFSKARFEYGAASDRAC